MVVMVLNVGAFLFAFLAAFFWFASARINTPKEIKVGFGGSGGSVQELGEAVIKQGKLSAKAAVFAGLSALSQGALLLLTGLGFATT